MQGSVAAQADRSAPRRVEGADEAGRFLPHGGGIGNRDDARNGNARKQGNNGHRERQFDEGRAVT